MVKNEFRFGGRQYPEGIRKFSLMLHYYGAAGYNSLRTFFNGNLPGKRTLQMWYGHLNVSPGICECALSILRERAESYQKEKGHQLIVSVIWDEMSIRKEICWNAESQSFIGFSTITNASEQGDDQNPPKLKVAKEALVFMVVGPDFKLAVAYHLLNGLKAIDRAALVVQVIREIENIDVRVISLTGDGLISNVTVGEILGANYKEDKPYFFSPTHSERKIYLVFDPPHMLKLVRKHFSLDKIYHRGELINWNHLRMLAEKQSSENFNLCNKLTMHHINWYQTPMNVKIAAETISKSVADALEQLREDGYEEFKDCKATTDFLYFFNDGYDILNFADKNTRINKYKQPICAETMGEIFSFGERLQKYIKELELELKTKKVPILKSIAQRGFFGFYHNFTSLKGIYEDLIKSGLLQVFYPFQFSQDHLENFFSLIRYENGIYIDKNIKIIDIRIIKNIISFNS